ncbi:MAG: LuxR C-terminal-related transcriptional regulator [Anaerolineae bacterium]
MDTNILFEALDNAADGAFVIDDNQRIVYWNQAAQALLGFTAEEVIGQACYKILEGQDNKGRAICRLTCAIATTAWNGEAVTNYDTCVHGKSGELRWLNMSILTFPGHNSGSSAIIVHLFRDATAKVQHEQFAGHITEAIEHLRGKAASPPVAPAPSGRRAKELTEREYQVLSLLAQGHSTHNIARSLSISTSTARNHIQNILRKLEVHSRLEALAYAYEHGLMTTP